MAVTLQLETIKKDNRTKLKTIEAKINAKGRKQNAFEQILIRMVHVVSNDTAHTRKMDRQERFLSIKKKNL